MYSVNFTFLLFNQNQSKDSLWKASIWRQCTWRTNFPAVTRWFLTKSLAHSGENIRTSWHRESTQNLLPSRTSSGLTNRKCSSFNTSNTSDMLKKNQMKQIDMISVSGKKKKNNPKTLFLENQKTHQSCFIGRYNFNITGICKKY